MIKFLVLFSLVLLINPNSQAQTDACNTVIITGNDDYPPIIWKSENSLIGVAVEVTEKALNEAGQKNVKSVFMGNWKRAQQEVKNGQADILLAPYYTEERAEWLDYVQPSFMLDPNGVFYNHKKPFQFKEWKDLIGKTGVMPRGNSFGQKFDEYAKQNLKVLEANSIEQAVKMLEAGRVDYLIYGVYPTLVEIKKLNLDGKILQFKESIISEGFYIAFSKKSKCRSLASKMTPILEKMAQDKFPESLVEKYLNIWKEKSKK